MASLTRAQLDVVALVAEGLPNIQIAQRLRIAEATVKAHVGQAIKRLGLSNRVQLALWYVRRVDEPNSDGNAIVESIQKRSPA